MLILSTCSVDLERRTIHRADGTSAPLTDQEHALLAYLAADPGRTVPHDELLERVWGWSALARTRAIAVAVRRLRRRIEADPAEPRHLVTVRGVGYRLDVAPPRDPPSDVAPSRWAGRMVGRADALAAVRRRVSDGARVITVSGPPGIGKSRVAAEALRDHSPAPVFASLGDAGPTTWCAPVAQALGVELDPSDPVGPVVAVLRARGPTLIVLDDADPVLDALAPAVDGWLAADPHVQVVVAARGRLRLPQEHVVVLDPLTLDASAELLVERAAGGRWRDGPELRAIAARLEGNPLALELIAARAEVLGPTDALALLDQRLPGVGAGATAQTGVAPRQASLHGAIAWSWSLLSPVEQRALAALAVFDGGFDLAGAAAVAERPSAVWWLDVLQGLVERSLVRATEASPPAPIRFELPASVRAFAAHALPEVARAAGLRHRDALAELADRLIAQERRDDPAAIGRLVVEAGNLRAAMARARADRASAVVARLALALDRLYAARGPSDERARVLDAALAEAPPPEWRARLLVARARAAIPSSDLAGAQAMGAEAERLAASLPDPDVGLAVRLALAELHTERGAPIEARDAALACADRARAADDPATEALALRIVGMLYPEAVDLGRLEAAVERLDALDQRTGDRGLRGHARYVAARLATARGRHQVAVTLFGEAVAAAEAIGDRRRVAVTSSALGEARAMAGDLDGAFAAFHRSLTLEQAMGRRDTARIGGNLAVMLVALDRMTEALRWLDPAIADARARGLDRVLGRRLVARALARWRLGATADARDDCAEAVRLLRSHGSVLDVADASAVAALVCAALGDLPAARAHLADAEPFRDAGGCVQFLRAVEGHVRLAEGDRAAAQALLDGVEVPSEPIVLARDSYLQYLMLPAEIALVARPLRDALGAPEGG